MHIKSILAGVCNADHIVECGKKKFNNIRASLRRGRRGRRTPPYFRLKAETVGGNLRADGIEEMKAGGGVLTK